MTSSDKKACYTWFGSERSDVMRNGYTGISLRLDVTKTFAHFYAQGGSRPLLTLFALPYHCGGVQLWSFWGSGYFRNLRVTQLSPDDVLPGFDNPWRVYAALAVIRTWQITLPQKSDFGATDIPEEIFSPEVKWITAESDGRRAAEGLGRSAQRKILRGQTKFSGK